MVAKRFEQWRYLGSDVNTATRAGGETRVTTEWSFEGDELLVEATQWEPCTRAVVRRYEVRDVVERHLADDWRIAWGLGAAATGAVGAGAFALPEIVGAAATDSGRAASYAVGSGLLAAALLQLVVVVTDSAAAADDTGAWRTRTVEGPVEPVGICGARGVTDLEVALTLPGGERLDAGRPVEGRWRIPLPAPEEAVGGTSDLAWLEVGSHREPVALVLWSRYAALRARDRTSSPDGQGGAPPVRSGNAKSYRDTTSISGVCWRGWIRRPDGVVVLARALSGTEPGR